MTAVNRFKQAWDAIEHPDKHPQRFRNLVEIAWEELERKVASQEPAFVERIVHSLYAGDSWIVKGAFPKAYLIELRERVWDWWQQSAPSFHKMVEGCPDFHRVITADISQKYYANPVKHSAYFFPWNGDPLKIFPTINRRWRIFKFLGGLNSTEYEQNTPKDGIVDRIQIVHYPAGAGKIETHADPYEHMKPVLSTYMSKRGEDYQSGGFYLIDRQDQMIDVEDHIDIGDMAATFPTVAHGVAVVDPGITPDTSLAAGRWWLGMFSNASDVVANRHTGKAVQIGTGAP